MSRFFFVFMLVLVGGSMPDSPLFGQSLDMFSVYRLDWLHVKHAGDSTRTVSRYWVQNAKRELIRLNEIAADEITADQLQQKEDLQTALGPLLELENLHGNTPPRSPERDKLGTEVMGLYSDPNLAESVFDIMGAERCSTMAINRCRSEFKWRLAKNENSWGSVGSYFQNKTFLTLINLTDSQKQSIESERARVIKRLKSFVTKKIDEQKKESDRRWDRLLEILDAEQREIARQILGQPVEWFRIPKSNTFDQGSTWLSTHATFNGSESLKLSSPFQMSKDELEKNALLTMDSLVYQMMYATSLWPEFELVTSQTKALNGPIRKEINRSGLVMPQPGRLKFLLNAEVTFPDCLNELLLPNQLEWFQQIELQIRLGKKYDPVVGLLHPKMVDHLRLSSKQQASIKKIGDEYLKSEKAWQKELHAENQSKLKEFHRRVEKALTDEQRSLYERLTGQRLTENSPSTERARSK